VLGIIFTIVGIVFDWFNFSELRRNQKNIEKTEIECCDYVNVYPWIYLALVIIKMCLTVTENVLKGISLRIGSDELIVWQDKWSLIITFLLSVVQCLDLLLLVIFSFECLQRGGSNDFHDLIWDIINDFLSGFFGTVGLFLSLTVKKHILAVFKVAGSCCRETEINTCYCVFSVLLMICVVISWSLAIILFTILIEQFSDKHCTVNGGVNCTMTIGVNCTMAGGTNCTMTDLLFYHKQTL
jgi:hypothetical protein